MARAVCRTGNQVDAWSDYQCNWCAGFGKLEVNCPLPVIHHRDRAPAVRAPGRRRSPTDPGRSSCSVHCKTGGPCFRSSTGPVCHSAGRRPRVRNSSVYRRKARSKLLAKPTRERFFSLNISSSYSRSFSAWPCWAVSPRPEHHSHFANGLTGTIISGGEAGVAAAQAHAPKIQIGSGAIQADACVPACLRTGIAYRAEP